MKPMMERVDPELIPSLEMYRAAGLDIPLTSNEDFLRYRESYTNFTSLPPFEGVDIEEKTLSSYDGVDIGVRVYRPSEATGTKPLLLWIHGGGFIIGKAAQDDPVACTYARMLDCVVVSVEYRLAPEFPFPTPLEDCYSALKWSFENAAEMGIDTARIAIAGLSAGGGLAAGLAQLARDRNEVPIIFQLLGYPMLDDRNIVQIEDPEQEKLLWTSAKNLFGWRAFLGQEPGTDSTPAYAAPGRTEDLSGLPPTYIYVGDIDLFLAEDMSYAQRLIEAGVPTELHIYKDACHGFDFIGPETNAGQRCNTGSLAALKDALQK